MCQINRKHWKKTLKNEETLPEKYFDDSILDLFLKDEKITTERTEEKLLEIPTAKIERVKDGDMKISYSGFEGFRRFVMLASENSALLIEKIFIKKL